MSIIEKKDSIKNQKQQGFIKRGNELPIYYIPRRKSRIYWIQVRRAAAAAAAVEISLWTR